MKVRFIRLISECAFFQAAQAQEFAFGDGTSSVPILSAQLL
jgi:hypothetical protein